MSEVKLKNVVYRYKDVLAVNGVSLHIQEGEFFALLGPSGSGKTTILRLIAGFLTPMEGEIKIGDQAVHNIPAYGRNIGFVFQNYALFPHMTVAENVAYGLESRKFPKESIKQRVLDILDLVEMTGMANRRPSELSGGQQQRVALARALVTNPKVLLLDEPLAALDKKLRIQMQVELRQLQQNVGITTIFVTHDQEEAMTLSDRIAVLRKGKIVQIGHPREVYEAPKTFFVSSFIGESNRVNGKIVKKDENEMVIKTEEGDLVYAIPKENLKEGDDVIIIVRPENIRIHTQRPGDKIVIKARVDHIVYMGTRFNYHLRTKDGIKFIVFEQNGLRQNSLENDMEVFLTWNISKTLIMEEENE